MKLKSAVVKRGGEKKDDWSSVSSAVSLNLSAHSGTVDFDFRLGVDLPSRVRLTLENNDVVLLLNSIAKSMPYLSTQFAECAATASKKNVATIRRQERQIAERPAHTLATATRTAESLNELRNENKKLKLENRELQSTKGKDS